MIKINNLVKNYDLDKKALDHLNLEFNGGEKIAVVGGCGSGKTTLLNIIAGVSKYDIGDVLVDDKSINLNSLNVKKDIYYVDDNIDVFRNLTAMDFLDFIANVYSVSKLARDRVLEEVIPKLGLEDVMEKQTRDYSRGMRRKIMIAAVFLVDSKYVLIDEMFSSLDVRTSEIVMDMIDEEVSKGRTIIYTTNEYSKIEGFFDSIVILDKGVAIFKGSDKEFKNKYIGKSLNEVMLLHGKL